MTDWWTADEGQTYEVMLWSEVQLKGALCKHVTVNLTDMHSFKLVLSVPLEFMSRNFVLYKWLRFLFGNKAV